MNRNAKDFLRCFEILRRHLDSDVCQGPEIAEGARIKFLGNTCLDAGKLQAILE